MAPRRRRQGRKFLDSDLLAKASKVVSEFAKEDGIEIALLGGAAMQFYGSPRLTGDIDFVAAAPLAEREELRGTGVLSIGGKKYVTIGQGGRIHQPLRGGPRRGRRNRRRVSRRDSGALGGDQVLNAAEQGRPRPDVASRPERARRHQESGGYRQASHGGSVCGE